VQATQPEAGTRVARDPTTSIDMKPLVPPLDLPPPNGAAEPPCSTVLEQIQAPTQVIRPSESLRGKKLRRATGQDIQASARALEGKIPLGIAHGRPPDLPDLYTQGSTILEQSPVDPKAAVCIFQAQRSVLHRGLASVDTHIDPGTINTDPDVYSEASALLEREKN